MTKIKKMVSAKKVMAVMVLGLISGALLGAQQAMTLTPELESQVAAQLGSGEHRTIVSQFYCHCGEAGFCRKFGTGGEI